MTSAKLIVLACSLILARTNVPHVFSLHNDKHLGRECQLFVNYGKNALTFRVLFVHLHGLTECECVNLSCSETKSVVRLNEKVNSSRCRTGDNVVVFSSK